MTDRKKRVRGGHRASATKMVRRAEELLAAETRDQTRLAHIKLSLQEKLSVLKQLDSEIVDLVEEGDVADEIEQTDTYMEDVYAMIAKLEQLNPRVGSTAAPPATATAPVRPPDRPRLENKVKLPKLTIQPFKGELTTWTSFWDSYQAAIDDNTSLSDIDKFNYLRSLLQGPALDAVAGLTLSAANYQEAISVLKDRFGNKQQIVAKHMDALLNIEAVTSDSNLRALRRLYDTIESQVRGLKSLGVAPTSYGSLLSSVLLNKLPPEIRLLISRKIGGDGWELDRLMEILREEVQARERASASDATATRRMGKPPPTASTLLTGGSAGGSGNTPTCCYCRQPHLSHTCRTVESVEERKRSLLQSGRCFNCLRRGHLSRQCSSKGRCRHCQGRHHGSICSQKKPTSSAGDETPQSQPPTSTPSAPTPPASTTQNSGMNPAAPPFKATSLWTSGNQAVLLQTAKALVFNPDDAQHSKTVRIVLDSGSQRSYITDQLKEELALYPNGEQSMSIMTFGSHDEVSRVCKMVDVCMVVKGGGTRRLTLYAVPTICEPLACQPITLCQAKFKHLAGLPLADQSDGDDCLGIDILIGSDLYWSLLTGKTRRGNGGPVGIDTELGWVLSGPVGLPIQGPGSATLMTHTLRVESLLRHDAQALDERLQTFWNLESFGIIGPDRSVLDEFQDKVRFVQGRYEVCLPWKDPDQILPDNRQLSERRLYGLLHRLKQDQEVFTEYDAVIKKQLEQGIVEIVEPSEEIGRIHYLPHHAVVRRDKETTKMRIVYDASAKSSGPSLNECLHAGPKFDQRILDLLLRFRVHKVALIADIEKAFLMISMAQEDRNVLRFLWVDDIRKSRPELITLRFARVVFGVSASPFLLNATIRHHLEKYCTTQPTMIEKLLRSFYVDDVVTGANDEQEAYILYQTSKAILKEGGFNLRKFCSNSLLLQMMIDKQEMSDPPTVGTTLEADETYASSALCSGHEHHSGEKRVLGIRWDIATDQLVMGLEGIAAAITAESEPTKRSIVSLVGKIYDPLGLLSPIVVRFKIFLQELCEARLEWDEPLTESLLLKWRYMSRSVSEGQLMFTQRCFFSQDEVIAVELCGFCDSSLKAYAAVVYLRAKTACGYQVSLVASKTRVSPLKQQTIPRLELLSALLLARLMSSIVQALQSELHLSKFYCFTDSTVALHWILGVDKSWKPFVQNRVAEIRRLFPPECWSHCAGRDNPADLPSRGLSPQELADSQLWPTGPVWLKNIDLGRFPDSQMPEECLVEMRRDKTKMTHGLMTSVDPPSIEQLMDIKDYSSLSHLLTVTEQVLKFGYTLLSKVRSDSPDPLSDFRSAAERLWIVASQRSLIADKNFTQFQLQFGLFQDDAHIWRCGGRLQKADLPASTIHPILLSRSHPLTKLYVQQAHERVMHSGVKSTLVELRSRFWIVKGRSFVRRTLSNCWLCKRFHGRPYQAPPPPPLPSFRVEEAPPFTHTGVDFAGPLYVKDHSSSSKTWICLYTCCVTRAVHLDLVPDLSTEAFLRSFKRFAARRGVPAKLVSDNGKTFKAAARMIRSIVRHKDVQHYLSGLGVKWIFNLPKAPWWGGLFERLVGLTKRCLRKIIGQSRLTYDELSTALTEVEAVLNSRPLSCVTSDDLDEPLTPSHLLTGRRILSLPDHLTHGADEAVESGHNLLTKRVQYVNNTINSFWLRWRKEYLLELREAHRYHHGRANPVPVAVDDVVIIQEKNQPRAFWKLGRVKDVLTGRDGAVRGATVRVAGQGRQATLLNRPIQLLYPLEVSAGSVTPNQPTPTSAEPGEAEQETIPQSDQQESADDSIPQLDQHEVVVETDETRPQRPRRAAARDARDRLLAQALSEN